MQGNCWFFSCFGGRAAGTKEAELHELISHSAIEEVGVHGSRLFRLAKLLLILAHRLELLLIHQKTVDSSHSSSSHPHLPCSFRQRSIPQEAPGGPYPKSSLGMRGWERRQRHPEPHSQPVKSLLSLELYWQAKWAQQALPASYFSPELAPRPHAAAPGYVPTYQSPRPLLLLRKNWICYLKDKDKYTFIYLVFIQN